LEFYELGWPSDAPKVGREIEAENVGESKVVNGGDDTSNPEDDTNVGKYDLAILIGTEDDRGGVEVCDTTLETGIAVAQVEPSLTVRALCVALLAGRVLDKIHRPSGNLQSGKTSF
jgi:hypothetical protein